MKEDSAKTRTMDYLKRACDAGAQRQAMYILKSVANYGNQDAFVDWQVAAKELKSLVISLPAEKNKVAR